MRLKYLKFILVFLVLAIGFLGWIGISELPTHSLQALTNINEIPMYGNQTKNKKQIAADEQFIKETTSDGRTRESVSVHLSKRGWEAYFSKDYALAIRRFNQAWMLDESNFQVYWGFSAIMANRQDLKQALEFILTAHQLNPKSANLMADVGQTYARLEKYDKAVMYYEKVAKMDPKNEAVFFRWAVVLFEVGKYHEANKMIEKAKALGGKSIHPQFLKDLQNKLKNQK